MVGDINPGFKDESDSDLTIRPYYGAVDKDGLGLFFCLATDGETWGIYKVEVATGTDSENNTTDTGTNTTDLDSDEVKQTSLPKDDDSGPNTSAMVGAILG